MTDLITELRKHADLGVTHCQSLMTRAADALAAQQAKINEARDLDLRHDIPPHRAWPAYQDAVRRILSDEQGPS